MSGPFESGERILLVDPKGRRYLLRLESGQSFHHHRGIVPHDLILGTHEGTVVHSSTGIPMVCLRPRLADFVLKMGRGAQIVYPKDLGPILIYADVRPGSRILEAGTGSGALSLALCRATGPEGRIASYEIRPEFLAVARANVEAFFGKIPEWIDLREGDVRGVAGTGETFDRAILDLPEPWAVLPEVGEVLEPGGILCSYLPTTGQVQSLVLALAEKRFAETQTFEVMLRTWHVTARSVRPDHRMVAHTGFITVSRKTAQESG